MFKHKGGTSVDTGTDKYEWCYDDLWTDNGGTNNVFSLNKRIVKKN